MTEFVGNVQYFGDILPICHQHDIKFRFYKDIRNKMLPTTELLVILVGNVKSCHRLKAHKTDTFLAH